jgi:hypothetical protein
VGPLVVLPGPRVSVSAPSGLKLGFCACRAFFPFLLYLFIYLLNAIYIYIYTFRNACKYSISKVMTCIVKFNEPW